MDWAFKFFKPEEGMSHMIVEGGKNGTLIGCNAICRRESGAKSSIPKGGGGEEYCFLSSKSSEKGSSSTPTCRTRKHFCNRASCYCALRRLLESATTAFWAVRRAASNLQNHGSRQVDDLRDKR